MKTGIVLIHGAGLGGWIWRDMVQYLDLPYQVVNFPFRDSNTKITNLRLSDYCAEIHKQIMKCEEFSHYVVVGHSIGSVPAIYLTKQQSDRVKGFVALSSLLPSYGESFVSQLPLVNRVILSTVIKLKGTKPPPDIIKSSICNDLEEDVAEMVASSYATESPYLFFDPSKCELPQIPSLYIKTKRDKDIPTGLQQKMADKLDSCSVDSINTGHLPMLSQPEKLSIKIQNFAKLF